MSIFGSSHFGLPRLKPLSSKRAHVVSVLDIGSTKVVCMIGRLTPRAESEILPGRTHNVEIIGIGHQKSRGVKNGVITDPASTLAAILAAVTSGPAAAVIKTAATPSQLLIPEAAVMTTAGDTAGDASGVILARTAVPAFTMAAAPTLCGTLPRFGHGRSQRGRASRERRGPVHRAGLAVALLPRARLFTPGR